MFIGCESRLVSGLLKLYSITNKLPTEKLLQSFSEKKMAIESRNNNNNNDEHQLNSASIRSLDNDYDVLILGAGISGLTAAHRLVNLSRKLKIAVIEAQDRYGGRLQTQSYGDGFVDLGGTWIHGADERNAAYRYSKAYGLVDCDAELFDRKLGDFLSPSGSIDQNLAGKLYDELKEIEYDAMHLPETDPRSFDQYIDDRVQLLKTRPEYENIGDFVDSAVWYAKKYVQLHGGDALHRMSAWGFGYWSRYEIDGDALVKGGYGSLLARMVCDIGVDKLRLNEQVLNIDWTMSSQGGNNNNNNNNNCQNVVRVRTNRANLTAKHLLVTFSLGVLKATHRQLFTPCLPPKKVHAIESLGFGKLEKIFLHYNRPFWRSGELNCMKFYSTESERAKIVNDTGNDFVEIINGFEELQSTKSVILGWVTGENVHRLRDYSLAEIQRQCNELIRLYTGNDSIPDADNILVTGWTENQFIRGSYSYPSMTTASAEEFSDLAKPIDNRVFFAGEAAHVQFYSAVHGAMESGIEAADAIYRASSVHFSQSKL